VPKKQVLQINKFSGGVNSYSDPRDLKEGEFQILDNAAVDEEGVIRVSGALELKDNLSIEGYSDNDVLSIPGKGLYSFPSDYILSSYSSINTYLQKDGEDTTSAWGVVHGNVDGGGTWAFSQSITNTNNAAVSSYGMSSAAISYDTHAIANDATTGIYNHGSLTFKGLYLEPGKTYKVLLNCISEKPWHYLGANIPPRIRLYNSTLGKYLYPEVGFKTTSDETHTAVLDNDIGNFVSSPSGTDTAASGNITYGSTSWTASTGCKVSRVALSKTVPLEYVRYNQDRDIDEATVHWARYEASTTLASYVNDTSTDNRIEITGTTGTTAEGAQLTGAYLLGLKPGKTYTVSAQVVSTSGAINTFYYELGGVESSSFNIGTGTTAITKDITLPTTFNEAVGNRTLRIYAKNNSEVPWYIDNVSVYNSDSHRSYNSFFGSTDTSDTYSEGTAYAMKVEAKEDDAGPFAVGNYAKSHSITVSAGTTYLFDCIYNTS